MHKHTKMVGPMQETYVSSKLLGPMLLKLLRCKRQNQSKPNVIISISLDRKKTSDDGAQGPSGGYLQAKVKTEKRDGQEPQTCRICLKEGDIPIFGDDDVYEDVSQYIDMFGGIKLDEDDEYPKYICNSCNALLQSALRFRKTAQQSDKILREQGGNYLMRDISNIEADTIGMDQYNDDDDKGKSYKFNVKTEQEPEKFNCAKCCMDFKSNEEYENHRLSEEHKKNGRTCPICKNRYSRSYLPKHIALHNQDYKYMCDVCGKKFVIKGQFDHHHSTHFLDNLDFKCDLCPYKGRLAHDLKMHMRKHTGEKPYQCPQCPTRAFVSKSNLNKHMLVHKDHHEFKCTECQKGFHYKRNLDLHFKVDHVGIKDHVCNLCGKPFGYRKEMIKHQLRVHKREKMRPGRTPLYILAELMKDGEQSEPTNA